MGTEPVPGELHLDAAQRIGPEVLARGADHHGHLRTAGARLGLRGHGPQRFGHGMRDELDLGAPTLRVGCVALALVARVLEQEARMEHEAVSYTHLTLPTKA